MTQNELRLEYKRNPDKRGRRTELKLVCSGVPRPCNEEHLKSNLHHAGYQSEGKEKSTDCCEGAGVKIET
jgi:hypothetical protein